MEIRNCTFDFTDSPDDTAIKMYIVDKSSLLSRLRCWRHIRRLKKEIARSEQMKNFLTYILSFCIIASSWAVCKIQQFYESESPQSSLCVLPSGLSLQRKGSTMSKRISLTQGKFAIVDDDMFDYLNQWKWYAYKPGTVFYAARREGNKIITMHRVIMKAKKGQQIDHRNRNGLNNRRCNLRFCNNSQNAQNGESHKNSSSIYKGVAWHKLAKKWMASICIKGKQIYLGLFISEAEAAKVYDKKAKELFGEFAKLNFMRSDNT